MKSDQLPKNLGKCVVDVVSLITVSDLLDVLINKKQQTCSSEICWVENESAQSELLNLPVVDCWWAIVETAI